MLRKQVLLAHILRYQQSLPTIVELVSHFVKVNLRHLPILMPVCDKRIIRSRFLLDCRIHSIKFIIFL